jgi:hypothetical protein
VAAETLSHRARCALSSAIAAQGSITNTRLDFIAVDMMDNASALPTCPQRQQSQEAEKSKLAQNHPLVCLKKLFLELAKTHLLG